MSKTVIALNSFTASRRRFVPGFKTLPATILAVAAAMLLPASHQSAHATTLTVSAEGLAAATAAETAFLLATPGTEITESFEGFTAANPSVKPLSILTSVGTFQQIVAGSGGACMPTTCSGLSILNSTTTPFDGRFAVGAGSKWLDSNDSREMLWTPTAAGAPTSLGFYITDADDVGGHMDILAVDGTAISMAFNTVFGASGLGNGKVFYLSIFDTQGIASLKFYSNLANDGYGIDKFSVSAVPEPEIYAMMAAGLGLMGFMTRRRPRQLKVS